MTEADLQQREAARRRGAEFRARRRRGAVLAVIEIEIDTLHGLVRLGLLQPGDRAADAVAIAAARFLRAAPAVALLGEAIFPPADGA